MPAYSGNSNRAATRMIPVALFLACCTVNTPAIAQTAIAQAVIAGMVEPMPIPAGAGKLEIGSGRHLFNEAHRLPAVRGNVPYRYSAAMEKSASSAGAGSSFNLGQAGITLVRQVDPLVFFAAVNRSFQAPRTINGLPIDRGNPTTLKLGSIFALSPATSMRMAIELTRAAERRFDGVATPGSRQLGAMLVGSYTVVLAPRVHFGVEAGIGLQTHAPSIRFIASMPLQF